MEFDNFQIMMNDFFDMAYKMGVRSSMIGTAQIFLEDIEAGKVIDADYFRRFIAFIQKQIFKEDYPSYQIYLQSDDWKVKANAAKERAGWRCQLCNAKGNESTLHAHHRTYERLGFEIDDDITILCSTCHAKFHDKD